MKVFQNNTVVEQYNRFGAFKSKLICSCNQSFEKIVLSRKPDRKSETVISTRKQLFAIQKNQITARLYNNNLRFKIRSVVYTDYPSKRIITKIHSWNCKHVEWEQEYCAFYKVTSFSLSLFNIKNVANNLSNTKKVFTI